MKIFKLAIVALFTLVYSQFSFAQKFSYCDTQYILSQMQAYKDAQQQIDKTVEGWTGEVQAQYKEINDLYKRFQAEQVLMTDAERKRREEEIVNKEKATRELQKKYFGPEGTLSQKRQEMVKPLQDQIYAVIEKIAAQRGLDFVFDKSNGVSMLFANPKYDLTDDILKQLGAK